MSTICPIYKPPHWTLRYTLAGIGGLFLYTSLTLDPSITLMDTPLIKTIQSEYPHWGVVMQDIVITIGVVGGAALLGVSALSLAKNHHASKEWIERIRRLDNRLVRNFLALIFFFARTGSILTVSLVVWYTIIRAFGTTTTLYQFPSFSSHPVIAGMGVIGLGLILSTPTFWQQSLMKRFCIHCFW